jgi:hypothetical protein
MTCLGEGRLVCKLTWWLESCQALMNNTENVERVIKEVLDQVSAKEELLGDDN